MLLEFTPAKLGNIAFMCFVYPLSSVDEAKNITVPDECNSTDSSVQSPMMTDDESNDVEGKKDTMRKRCLKHGRQLPI